MAKTDNALSKLNREYAADLEKVLHKTDTVLLNLSREYATYLGKVLPIQYKNKTYHLIMIFHTSQKMKCKICGNRSNPDVFIIENEDGKRLNLRSGCIDRLTNMDVSKWFRNYRKKRELIIKNRKIIDRLSSLLLACKKCELSCDIPFAEVEIFRAILDRMCKGINLNWQQETIVENYLARKKRFCEN